MVPTKATSPKQMESVQKRSKSRTALTCPSLPCLCCSSACARGAGCLQGADPVPGRVLPPWMNTGRFYYLIHCSASQIVRLAELWIARGLPDDTAHNVDMGERAGQLWKSTHQWLSSAFVNLPKLSVQQKQHVEQTICQAKL